MINFFPTHEQIANCAFFIYLNEGSPNGRQAEHWHQAETQLIADRFHDMLPALISGNSATHYAPVNKDAIY